MSAKVGSQLEVRPDLRHITRRLHEVTSHEYTCTQMDSIEKLGSKVNQYFRIDREDLEKAEIDDKIDQQKSNTNVSTSLENQYRYQQHCVLNSKHYIEELLFNFVDCKDVLVVNTPCRCSGRPLICRIA